MIQGGLNMVNAEARINTFRIKWIQRMLETNKECVWRKMIDKMFKPFGGLNLILEFSCTKENDVKHIFQNQIPEFYEGIIKTWFKLREKVDKDTNVTENELIWANKHIRYKGAILYNKKWIQAGITRLKDVIKGNRFINLAELSIKVKSVTNIFDLHKLISSIPKKWKEKITNRKLSTDHKQSFIMFMINNKLRHICDIESKSLYKLFNVHHENASCIKHWERENIYYDNWENIFRFKINNRILNKIGQFEYNILYNLICCRKNLFTWKLVDTNRCHFCNVIDDYDHFFITCNENKDLWLKFSNYVKCVMNNDFEISLYHIVCGWNIDRSEFDFVNILIELASFAVYKSKMIYNQTQKNVPNIVLFTQEFKKLDDILSNTKMKTKYQISKKELHEFKVYWSIK